MKRVALLVMLVVLLVIPFVAQGEWTEGKLQALTSKFQEYKSTWTPQDTASLLRNSQNTGMNVEVFKDNSGRTRKITVMGGTSVLVDGKDISGNLGSKTTHGNNSPIIDNVEDSQITTGNRSPIEKDVEKTTSFKIHIGLHIALSVALTISVLANIVSCRTLKMERAANKALHPIPERPRLSETGEC